MLELVRELAEEMKVGFAWHTGSVPQGKRRQEIRRFKDDAGCRLFLSTDSGGLGLNLQAASAVVNLDLPWNPARLEQRIARAWRKHQPRPVQVIHLVTEESIEHRMLGLLAGKQTLAEGVLDGSKELDAMPLPSGRAAFLERLEELLELRLATDEAALPPEVPAPERLRQDLSALLGERLLMLDLFPGGEARPGTVLAVVDGLEGGAAASAREEVAAAVGRSFGEGPGAPRLELLEARFGQLAVEGVGLLAFLHATRAEHPAATTLAQSVREWVERGEALLQRIEESLDRAALGGAL